MFTGEIAQGLRPVAAYAGGACTVFAFPREERWCTCCSAFSAMTHEIRAFNCVHRPYASVRGDVLAHPTDLFAVATSSTRGAKTAELHARTGPVEVGAHVKIEVLSITESTANDRPATKLALTWKAATSSLFPTMHATLSLYPLTPSDTQIELDGAYDPPLGAVGDMLDALAMRDIAQTSVQHFVDDVAAYLQA